MIGLYESYAFSLKIFLIEENISDLKIIHLRQYSLANKLSHLFDGRATQRYVYILVLKSLYSFEKESKKEDSKKMPTSP